MGMKASKSHVEQRPVQRGLKGGHKHCSWQCWASGRRAGSGQRSDARVQSRGPMRRALCPPHWVSSWPCQSSRVAQHTGTRAG